MLIILSVIIAGAIFKVGKNDEFKFLLLLRLLSEVTDWIMICLLALSFSFYFSPYHKVPYMLKFSCEGGVMFRTRCL